MQLFITTHSLETVKAFLEGTSELASEAMKVFPLELSTDGLLTTNRIPRDDALRLLASGLDLRDITT